MPSDDLSMIDSPPGGEVGLAARDRLLPIGPMVEESGGAEFSILDSLGKEFSSVEGDIDLRVTGLSGEVIRNRVREVEGDLHFVLPA